jgi:cytochrome c oxidase subunit IV
VEHTTAKGEATITVYLVVWAALVTFTGLTVALAGVGFGRAGILIVLGIAGTKTALIGAYFMHLRYERQHLYSGLVAVAFATLAIFTGLTVLEVAAR